MERYGVSLRIQSKRGKMRVRITPNTNTFHAVAIAAVKESEFDAKSILITTLCP